MTHELLRVCACVGSKQPKYTTWYKGRCQSGLEIKSISECSAAAKALGAPVTSASSDGLYESNSDPPFCYFKHGQLKFNAGNNRGSCDQAYTCLCLTAPPDFGATYHGEKDIPVCIHRLACVSKDLKLR